MTTQENERLEALRAFEEVLCGEFPSDKTGPQMGFPDISAALLYDAFSGSLDAAKALHEAVLPDEGWDVQWSAKYPHLMSGATPYFASVGWAGQYVGSADNPARAWLLAIIRALIFMEAAKHEGPTS